MNVVPRSTRNTNSGTRSHRGQSNAQSLSRQSNGRSNPEVVGSIPTEVKRFFSLPLVVPCFPLLGLTPSALFMGFPNKGNCHRH